MTSATELERLVVRLVGEGKQYKKVLDDAVRSTKKAAKDIDRISMRELSRQNHAMEEAARITKAVATPTESYARQLTRLKRLYQTGRISQETYKRALKQTTAAMPSVVRAQEKHNRLMQKGAAITEAARLPIEQYKRKVAEINILQRKGAISATTYTRTLKRLRKEFVVGAAALAAFGTRLRDVGGRMQMMGMMTTFAVTLPVAGMAKSFVDFDSAMTKSLAIMSNVSPAMRKEMEATAKSIAHNSVTSAKEAAAAYYYLASAGLDAAQSMAALPVVEQFAVAGAFDMAEATDLLTDAQSALGLSVKDPVKNMKNMVHVSDMLVKAATLANATVQQFSEALTNEAGAAVANWNMSLSESVAILAAYADQGLKGNAAGSMFGRMVRLVTNSINKNAAAFDKMGIPYKEFAATGKNITAVVEGIVKAVEGLGPAEKAAALQALGFEARIQQAIMPLLKATDKVREYDKSLEDLEDVTKDVADTQRDALSAQLKITWNRVKAAAMAIGKDLVPGLMAMAAAVRGAAAAFMALPPGMRFVIGASLGIVAVLGPLLLILGGLVKGIGSVVKVLALLKASMISTIASVTAITLGIVALVAVVWLIVDAFTEADLGMSKWYGNLETATGEKFATFWEGFFHDIGGWLATLGKDWEITWLNIKKFVSDVGFGIWEGLETVWAAIGRGFTWMKNTIARGLIWLGEQALHIMSLTDITGAHEDRIQGQREIFTVWKEGIDLSESGADLEYDKALKQIKADKAVRQREYEQKVLGILRDEDKRMKAHDEKTKDIAHRAFLEKLPEGLKDKAAGFKKTKATGVKAAEKVNQELMDAKAILDTIDTGAEVAGNATAESTAAMRPIVKDVVKGLFGGLAAGLVPDVETMVKEMGGDAASATPHFQPRDFRQMSVRRFGLNAVGSSLPKTQEVADKVVAGKLGDIHEELQKKQVAVLG